MSDTRDPLPRQSSVQAWPPLVRFVALERRLGAVMARRPWTAFAYELLRFGLKQGWACLFGGVMVALLVATHLWYPASAPISRYDALFLAAVATQIALIATRLETLEEAKIIAVYHVVGTAMEVFKTSIGSWLYPEPSLFHIYGVPLFSGFMYAAIGSYLVRAWRLFAFRFTRHPPIWSLILLSLAIYGNFFSHHYLPDLRLALFATAALLFGRSFVHYTIWRKRRAMPLLLGFVLVSLFIWLAENIGTFTRTWLYPSQVDGWSMVSLGKLGSWFLLLLISYTLVALIHRPRPELRTVATRTLPLREASLEGAQSKGRAK